MFTFPFSELSNDEFLGFFPRNYDEYDNHIYWYGNWYPLEAAYPEAPDENNGEASDDEYDIEH